MFFGGIAKGRNKCRERRHTRMNAAPRCYSHFFDVAASRAGSRIRNDEVVGSIPTSSTKLPNPFAADRRVHIAFHFSARLCEVEEVAPHIGMTFVFNRS